MSVHGCSFAEFANMYSQISLVKYLGFRDMPDLLQTYTKGNKALDFGCGHGESTEFLKKLGFMVDGVDINEHMIDLARKVLPENNLHVLQDSKIPANDEQYDLVFASWVLQEIAPKDNLLATLSEIARVLRKDGIFVTVVPSEAFYGKDWTHANAEFEENQNLKSGDKVKILFKESNFIIRPYFWTENDYRDGLKEAGLDVILKHQPLGRDDEGFVWMYEKKISPYDIFVARKKIVDDAFL